MLLSIFFTSLLNVYIAISITLLYCNFASADTANDSQHLENRYIFDIGSSSIKMKGYQIDKQNNAIKHPALKYYTKVSHKKCLLNSSNGKTLTNKCLKDTIQKILDLQSIYNVDCKKAHCKGFATAWARDTANIQDVIRSIKTSTSLDISVISQEDEGILAFNSVQMLLDKSNTKLKMEDLVFDMGGGSFQIVGKDKDKKLFVFDGHYGTESLAYIMRDHFKGSKNSYISCSDLAHLYKLLEHEIGSKIKNHPQLSKFNTNQMGTVYGISLFLRKTFPSLNSVSKEHIRNLNLKLCDMHHKKAAQLYPHVEKSGYIQTLQSGLILLDSIMHNLDIREIQIIDTDLQDHVALHYDLKSISIL